MCSVIRNIFIVSLLLMVGGCATTLTKDIKVEAETAPGVMISDYNRYTWLGSASLLYDPKGKWEPRNIDMDAEIEWLIDRELRARGKTKVSTGADLIVAYIAGVDMESLELEKDPGEKISMLKNVPKGALVIMLLDVRTGNAVWAGAAVADVRENPSAQTVKKRLDYAVSRMFMLLPK